MKSLQEFEQFLATDTELVATIANVEKQRKNTKGGYLIAFLIVIVFLAVAGYFIYNNTKETGVGGSVSQNNIIYLILIFIGAAFTLTYVYSFVVKKNITGNPDATAALMSAGSGDFQFNFKDRVVRKMVAFWDPSFRYQINNHIKAAEVLESGMIYPRNYKAGGSDMIQGEIDGVAFRFSDLHLLREKTYVGKNEDPYETIMFGSFFIAGFQKEFKNPVFIYSKSSFDALQYKGEKVLLEDPEFMNRFNVYAPDQIEARCILTTSMMERIKAMATKMGNKLYIAFANNKVYVMNNNSKDRFEPSWFTNLDKKESLIGFYNELAEQLSIIEELKLNVNAWKA
jgi:hypothetical protein